MLLKAKTAEWSNGVNEILKQIITSVHFYFENN